MHCGRSSLAAAILLNGGGNVHDNGTPFDPYGKGGQCKGGRDPQRRGHALGTRAEGEARAVGHYYQYHGVPPIGPWTSLSWPCLTGGGGARFDSPRVVHGDRRCHDDHRHDGDDGLQDAKDAAARRPPRRSRGRRPPRGRHGRFTRRACASTPSVVRGCKRTPPQHTVRPAGMMTQPSPGGRPFLGGTIVM